MSDLTRRSLTRTVAWSVPVVAVAATAPAFATSSDPITGILEASKCPGKSTDDPDTVIVTFRANSESEAALITKEGISSLTVNGTPINVDRVVIEGSLVHVVTTDRNNSADASGLLVINYTIGTQTFRGEFAYSGSHPNQTLCKRI